MGVFTMPSLGADMESGRIVEWLVQPGDRVHRGDVVAVVDTTKAAIEVEVFEDGTVTELLVRPGTEVEVGTPLATIATDVGEPDTGGEPDLEAASAEDRIGGPVDDLESTNHLESEQGRELPEQTHPITLRATPPVRHLAHQLGVNLDSLAGSGPDGHITRDDVQEAAPVVQDLESGPERAEPRENESAAHPHPGPEPATPSAGPAEPREPQSRSRPRATPRARRLAAEHHIELTAVTGTGRDGAITGPDVEEAARAKKTSEPADVPEIGGRTAGSNAEVSPESGHARGTAADRSTDAAKVASRTTAGEIAAGEDRRAMRRSATAALMARSAREIPHYYVSQTIDLTLALDWLRSHNADLPVRERVLPAALFLRGTVLAAQEVEELNGHWLDDTFVPADGVQLGVAVAMRDGGLLTPAILDAHLLDLDELMARLADLVRRARSGRLRSREIAPGSITVSSLADRGPDALFGVIYPPQVALVGIGGVAERPWSVDGALAARPTVTLTVAADHRATDGRIGADFLSALSSALTRPEEM